MSQSNEDKHLTLVHTATVATYYYFQKKTTASVHTHKTLPERLAQENNQSSKIFLQFIFVATVNSVASYYVKRH